MFENAIDREKPQKLYFQLLKILTGHIENDEWRVGTQIPTEDQLCIQYNVSKATVRLAVAELVSLGYLKKFQGKGTFVRRKKPGNGIPMLLNLGQDNCPSCLVRMIENKTQLPGDEVRDRLNLSDGNYCLFASRVIIVDGVPRVMQKIHISCAQMHPPPHSLLDEEIRNHLSHHAFLEFWCGARIQRMKETTDIALPGAEESAILELTPDRPVLRVRDVCCSRGDEPMSYSESIYRMDGYARTLEFERLKI